MAIRRAAFAAALAAILFAGLGRLPLLDPDEGRYARAAQEMIERGDWVVPHLEGAPRLNKPIFFYWLEAASFTVLGPTEAAARLPSALAAAGTLLWLYLFARPRLGPAAAAGACAVLATTPLFFALARAATTDMVLTFFVFGATASLYAGIVEPVRPVRHLVAGGACLGLGLLTKGPVALLVPGLAVLAAAVARRRAPISVAGRASAAAWVALAVVAPWTVLLVHRVGWEAILDIWRRETLERYAAGLDHPERASYFLVTAPVTFFPWSALVPHAALAALRGLRRGEGLRPLLLAWAGGGLAFFTLGRGKLDSYLLPLAPAVALLVASAAASGGGAPEAGRSAARWAAWCLAILAAALCLPFPVARLARSAPAVLPSLALGAATLALAAALLARLGRSHALIPLAASAMGATLLGGVLFMPGSWAEERSTRALAREAGLRGAAGSLYTHRVRPYTLGFYAGRTPTYVPARYLLLKLVEDGAPASVVVEERRREVVVALGLRGFRVAARSGDLLALRREARGGEGDRETSKTSRGSPSPTAPDVCASSDRGRAPGRPPTAIWTCWWTWNRAATSSTWPG